MSDKLYNLSADLISGAVVIGIIYGISYLANLDFWHVLIVAVFWRVHSGGE